MPQQKLKIKIKIKKKKKKKKNNNNNNKRNYKISPKCYFLALGGSSFLLNWEAETSLA